MRRRIYRWYSELEAVDPDAMREGAAENVVGLLVKLDKVEAKVSHLAVPPGYSQELYALRVHIELLRNKLRNAAHQSQLSGEPDNPISTA